MDQPAKSNACLAPRDILTKRPSTEAIQNPESKKRNVGEGRTSDATPCSVHTSSYVQDLAISPDQDDHTTPPHIEALIKQPRIFRKPNLAGEQEQSTWAHCCNCEASGLIMSWPQCRHCLHNLCTGCEHPQEGTDRDRSTSHSSNLNELLGEMLLQLESLRFKPKQRKYFLEVWESYRVLAANVSELEGARAEASDSENPAEWSRLPQKSRQVDSSAVDD